MSGKSLYIMITWWADGSSAFSSPCVWIWNGRWCRLEYQILYSGRPGRWTIGHFNIFLCAELDRYSIGTLNSLTLLQLTIWKGGQLDSCRAASGLVRNNLARSGLGNFMGWPVQVSVFFVWILGEREKGKWGGGKKDEPLCTIKNTTGCPF